MFGRALSHHRQLVQDGRGASLDPGRLGAAPARCGVLLDQAQLLAAQVLAVGEQNFDLRTLHQTISLS